MFDDLVSLGSLILSVYSDVWNWLFTPIDFKILSESVNTIVNGTFSVIYAVGSIVGIEPGSAKYAFELSARPIDFLVTSVTVFLGYRIVKWVTDLLL